MNQTFEASRLSEGNKIFPCKIEFDNTTVTITIPGLFSGKSQTIAFEQISSVRVEVPLAGYSKIIFETTGLGRVLAHGFTKGEVNEMKDLVQKGKSQIRNNGTPANIVNVETEAVQLRKLELERDRELERKQSNKELNDLAKKYWKIWVPIAVLIFSWFVITIYNNNKDKKENEKIATEIQLQLEQLNDTIQMLINEGKPKEDILPYINRLVHPVHEVFKSKSKGFSTVYYDEYWQEIREEFKSQVLNNSISKPKEESIEPKINDNEKAILEQSEDLDEPIDLNSLYEDSI